MYKRQDSILINTSKGIEQSSMKPIFSIFKDVLPRVSKRYVTISGPSFAYDVASGLPTSVTLAASNSLLLPVAMKIFENQNFKTYTSKDIVGVELGGSLKNVIAIGAGILDGIKSSESTKAAFITRGLNEIKTLSKFLGAKNDTFMGLSGIGDLMLTAYGEQSRNRSLGFNIGKGKKISSKKKKGKPTPVNFQDTILNLQKFWGKYGCVILQPYDIEVGAGTFHPATTLRSLGPKPWKAAYVQPSRRPTDGRYGDNPNRLQHLTLIHI